MRFTALICASSIVVDSHTQRSGMPAAVAQFTRCLGVEVGNFGVRVNGIAPDMTNTPQVRYAEWVPPEQQALWPIWVPVGRMGTGDDIAAACLYLVSEEASYVTGQTVSVNGGAFVGW